MIGMDSDMDDDSQREDRRRSTDRRKMVHWTRDFSAGTIGLIVTWILGIGALYAGLSSENAKRDEKISTVQRDREEDRKQFSGALQDIKNEIRETTRAVNSTKEDVATVKAQLTVLQKRP